MIRYYEKVSNNGREAFLAEQKPRPLSAKERARRAKNLEKQIRFIVASQDKLGRWITTEPLETRGMKFDKRIEARIFISHIKTLSEYLNLLR